MLGSDPPRSTQVEGQARSREQKEGGELLFRGVLGSGDVDNGTG